MTFCLFRSCVNSELLQLLTYFSPLKVTATQKLWPLRSDNSESMGGGGTTVWNSTVHVCSDAVTSTKPHGHKAAQSRTQHSTVSMSISCSLNVKKGKKRGKRMTV